MPKRHLFTIATLSALTLVALTASFRAPAQAAQQAKPMNWEFLIETDVTVEKVEELAEENWEYVGYLGVGSAGERVDETLWKRQAL